MVHRKLLGISPELIIIIIIFFRRERSNQQPTLDFVGCLLVNGVMRRSAQFSVLVKEGRARSIGCVCREVPEELRRVTRDS